MPSSATAPKSATAPLLKFQLGGVMVVSFAHFVHDVYSAFLAPLLPLLIEKLSLSLTQAGLLTTVMQLPSLLNPWIGALADRISARWFLILAPAMTAMFMSLIGLAPTFGVLLLLMLFAGISAAAFHVPAPVVVARAAGSRRGLGMSFFMVGGEAARAVGPMAAIGAVSLFGLDGFYPVMVVGLLCSVLLAWATRGLPVSSKKRQPIPMLKTWGDLQHILGPITGILVARGFMHGAMAGFLPTFIKMNTHNLVLAAVGLTIYESAGIVGVFTAGSLSDRIGRRRVLTLSLVGAPVFLLTFIWVDGWASYLFLVLTGLTLLSTTPVMLALVQDRAGDSPAAANGLFMMISFLARSAVVVLIGCVADLIGLRSTFIACAVLGFSSLFFIRRLPRD